MCDGYRPPSEILRLCVTDSARTGDVGPIITQVGSSGLAWVDTPHPEEAAVPVKAPHYHLMGGSRDGNLLGGSRTPTPVHQALLHGPVGEAQ
jgi:hypothetical protein